MKKNNLVTPVLKWVGGKRQLLDTLRPLLPKTISKYCEPFIGGGAMLFDLQPKRAYVNDINSNLILVYTVIRDAVYELISCLQTFENNAETFYAVRNWDRDKDKYATLSDVQKAARIIYLNKTCYNGLYRVNNAGEFNAPFGNYKNPNIINAPVLKAVSSYFNTAEIHFSSTDYAELLNTVKRGTFVYLAHHMTQYQIHQVLLATQKVALLVMTKSDSENAVMNLTEKAYDLCYQIH